MSYRSEAPTAIEQHAEALSLTWRNGRECRLSAVRLRRVCPCAQCVNEWTGERTLQPDSVSESVRIEDANLVGRYALALRFSDKHETGIYSFRLLHDLCVADKES